MSKTVDVMTFYAKGAWEKSESGLLVPSDELLQDGGKRARDWLHPTDGVTMSETVSDSVLRLSTVEVAEALKDILTAHNMRNSEHRVMVIGRACIGLQNAELRIRTINKFH